MNSEDSGDNWKEVEEMRYNRTESDEGSNEIYGPSYMTCSLPYKHVRLGHNHQGCRESTLPRSMRTRVFAIIVPLPYVLHDALYRIKQHSIFFFCILSSLNIANTSRSPNMDMAFIEIGVSVRPW